MEISQFYQLLKESVLNINHPVKCKALQTFGVLSSMSELSTENLGKYLCDKNLPYFLSKAWIANGLDPSNIIFDFPALIVFENNFTTTKFFQAKGSERCYNLQIAVLDKYAEGCQSGDCTSCNSRVVNQIYNDTEILLDRVMSYVSEAVVANVGGNELLTHPFYLEYLKDNNLITSYEIDDPKTRAFQMNLRSNNESVNGFRKEGRTANNLYGAVYNLKICLNLPCIDSGMLIGNYSNTETLGLCC